MFTLVGQPTQSKTQPYQMAQKDRNGEAYSKEDTVTEEKEMESDRAQTEEDNSEDSRAWPSCRLTAHTVHTVQETAL